MVAIKPLRDESRADALCGYHILETRIEPKNPNGLTRLVERIEGERGAIRRPGNCLVRRGHRLIVDSRDTKIGQLAWRSTGNGNLPKGGNTSATAEKNDPST